MEQSSSQRRTVEHQFDSFCKKVLREECRDIVRARKRRANQETLFSEMVHKDINGLITVDRYGSDVNTFMVCGFEVAIESDLLAEALSALPDKSRDILQINTAPPVCRL